EPGEDAVERPRQRRAAEPPLAEDVSRLLPRLRRVHRSSFLQPAGGGQNGGWLPEGGGAVGSTGGADPGVQPAGGGQNGGCSVGGDSKVGATGGGAGPGVQPGGGGQNGGWPP